MSIRKVNKVGRPRIVTDELEAKVVAFLFKATLEKGHMPDDMTVAKQFGISERSFRSIRLKHGLDRWTTRRSLAELKKTEQFVPLGLEADELVCDRCTNALRSKKLDIECKKR